MKLVELFCGCGGFSRGAHDAGFEVAAAYDIDPILTSSYPRNFPGTPLYHRDVTDLTGEDIRRDVNGDVFGVFGGPPCQGFSEIGKRNPNDPRRSLLAHFFRIVRELSPAFFIMENVRGLAYPGARPLLDEAIATVKADYEILGPEVFEASQFGAATTRPRMFVIGIHKSRRRTMTIKHIDSQMAPSSSVGEAIMDLVGAKPLASASDLPEFDRWKLPKRKSVSAYAMALRTDDAVFTGHRATAHSAAVIARFAATSPGSQEKVGRHPRLSREGLCPTLRAGTGSEKGSFQSVRPIHPTEDRVITVREAARLQGFPDDHLFHPTVWHSFRMIGNSVSPIIAKAIFLALADALELDQRDGRQVEREVVDLASIRRAKRRQFPTRKLATRRRVRLAGR